MVHLILERVLIIKVGLLLVALRLKALVQRALIVGVKFCVRRRRSFRLLFVLACLQLLVREFSGRRETRSNPRGLLRG